MKKDCVYRVWVSRQMPATCRLLTLLQLQEKRLSFGFQCVPLKWTFEWRSCASLVASLHKIQFKRERKGVWQKNGDREIQRDEYANRAGFSEPNWSHEISKIEHLSIHFVSYGALSNAITKYFHLAFANKKICFMYKLNISKKILFRGTVQSKIVII